jgi:hypothetical protein
MSGMAYLLSDAQIMVNMALNFANLEGYELQLKEAYNYWP